MEKQDYLLVSEVYETICLLPHTGNALRSEKRIREYLNRDIYMNGYCWSALIRYFFKYHDMSGLLSEVQIIPSEEKCLFHICYVKKTEERIIQLKALAAAIREAVDDESRLGKWADEFGFEEWDDW